MLYHEYLSSEGFIENHAFNARYVISTITLECLGSGIKPDTKSVETPRSHIPNVG